MQDDDNYIQLNVAVPSSELWAQLIVQNSSGSCDWFSQNLSTTKPKVGNCGQSQNKKYAEHIWSIRVEEQKVDCTQQMVDIPLYFLASCGVAYLARTIT